MGDALFEGLEPSEDLLTAWRDGLGMNRAAPDDVLIALLRRGASFLWRRDVPSSVMDAAVRDPDPRVRAAILWHGHPIAEEHVARLAEDVDPCVRGGVCATSWPALTDGQRSALLGDPDDTVRAEAERADSDARARAQLYSPAQLAQQAVDPDPDARFAAACRPELSDEQREAIDIDVDPGLHWPVLEWVTALHDDPDAMRRLAASKVFLIRRSVARAKHLPPDVVERLANDPDRVVQLFLAESCDDAPADVLLRVAGWWPGSMSQPDVPRRHPNFPRSGLLRFADDPNPYLRRLALDDPDSTADYVERFIDDPDENVRYRAACDPRISARTAERLLSGSDWRRTVAANPGLPQQLLMTLLRDEQTACAAAQNPALPTGVMRDMVRRIALLPGDS